MLACLGSVANAHDIGVSQAELSEQAVDAGRTYVLQVMAGANSSARFQTPVLPEQCTFTSSPRGVQGTGWKRFEFRCARGLTPDDELNLPWLRDGVMMTVTWADGSVVQRLFKYDSGLIRIPLAELQVGSASWAAAVKRYTVLGIEHILEGYDHLLFVFALLIIVSSGWLLVKTITAFTVAHSITLAMATLGFVQFPSRPVEAAIALSIVFLALEVLHQRNGRIGLTHKAPWVVAFGFGLLHGFGFAGALSDIGLPQAEIPIALLSFNIGVEIGQLLFVLAIVILKNLLSRAKIYSFEKAGVFPAYAIGTIAMFWLFERILAMVLPIGSSAWLTPQVIGQYVLFFDWV